MKLVRRRTLAVPQRSNRDITFDIDCTRRPSEGPLSGSEIGSTNLRFWPTATGQGRCGGLSGSHRLLADAEARELAQPDDLPRRTMSASMIRTQIRTRMQLLQGDTDFASRFGRRARRRVRR
jgi:hypothetical protein